MKRSKLLKWVVQKLKVVDPVEEYRPLLRDRPLKFFKILKFEADSKTESQTDWKQNNLLFDWFYKMQLKGHYIVGKIVGHY